MPFCCYSLCRMRALSPCYCGWGSLPSTRLTRLGAFTCLPLYIYTDLLYYHLLCVFVLLCVCLTLCACLLLLGWLGVTIRFSQILFFSYSDMLGVSFPRCRPSLCVRLGTAGLERGGL
jgi:hypothetical protein